VSAGIEERIAVYVCKTRKELERNTHEVDQRSKTLIREINEQKVRVDTAVEGIRQELGQTKEGLNKGIESLTNEVRTVTDTLQTERQRNLPEIQKVNLAVSRLEAKISGGLAAQNQSAVSVSNVPDNSCTENVNALSVVLPSGTTDLNDLSLLKFSNSAKQVVSHFLRELEEYFMLRKTPSELKLPLYFRVIEDPFAKQWFATVYDSVGTYENFKTAFSSLLWGQTRQAQIRSSIYQDRWDKRSDETYAEHYIRYASMSSMLNPPMS